MNQTITHSLQEDALLAPRRASSIAQKGMFLNEEEPLLLSTLILSLNSDGRDYRNKAIFSSYTISVLSPFISHLIRETSHSPPRYYRRGVRGEATFIGVTSLIMSLLSVKGKERKKYSYYFCNLYQSIYRNNKGVGIQHVHYM